MSVSRKVQMGAGGGAGTPWSLEDVSYKIGSGKNNHLGPQDFVSYSATSPNVTLPYGIDFNTDGTIAFVLTQNSSASDLGITSYTLSTPYDLSTAVVLAGGQPTTSAWTAQPNSSFRITPDGMKMHLMRASSVYQFAFTTAWDVTTMSQEASYSLSGYGPAFVWNNDGSILYVYDNSTGAAIAPITLTDAYDFLGGYSIGTSYTFTNSSFLPATPSMFDFSHDGTVLYTHQGNTTGVGALNAVEVATAYDLSTIDDTNQSSRDAKTNRVMIPGRGGRIISDSSSVRFFGAWYNTTYAGYYGFNGRGISCSLANEAPNPATNPNAFEWEFKSSVFAPQYDAGGNLNNIYSTDWIRDFWFENSGSTLNTFRTNSSSDAGFTTQNTLSTAYDVGSVSSLGTSTIYAPSGNSFRLQFMDDGNKFAVLNYGSSGYISTYTTSTPYDVSGSATKTLIGTLGFNYVAYASMDRILSNIYSVSFNDDGTKMFLGHGNSSNNLNDRALAAPLPTQVITITLSTAWDPSTGDWSEMPWIVYDQGACNATPTTSHGFEWNSTGTTFYTAGSEYGRFWAASPQTAYHVDVKGNFSQDTSYLSNGNYWNIRYSNAESFQFKPDGTRYYVYDRYNAQIFQSDLSTAYDVVGEQTSLTDFTSAPNNTFKRNDNSNNTYSITLNPTGTRIYRLTDQHINEYTLSTAWDLSTASASPTATLSVLYSSLGYGDLVWGNSGFKLYRLGRYGSTIGAPFIEEYTASTAYDLGSVNTTPTSQVGIELQTGSTVTFPGGFKFNPSGTRIIVAWANFNTNTEGVSQFDLSTAWDISSMSGSSPHPNSGQATLGLTNDVYPYLEFNSTGTTAWFSQGINIYEYTLSTAWDISSTLTNTRTAVMTGNGFPFYGVSNTGFVWADSGTKLFRSSRDSNGAVVRFDLSTAYNLNTMTIGSSGNSFSPLELTNLYTTSSYEALGLGVEEFRLSSDGTKVFIVARNATYDTPAGNNNAYIARYDLSTAWDISTASYHSYAELDPATTSSIYTFDISSNGEWIIYSEYSGGELRIAQMTTAYDLSTLQTSTTFASANSGVTASQMGITASSYGATAVRFNSDGTSLYVRTWYITDESAYVKVDLPSAYTLGPVEIKFPNGMEDGGSLDNLEIDSTNGSYILDTRFENNGEKFYVTWNQDGAADVFFPGGSDPMGINEYTLTTPYDITTGSITYANTLDLLDEAYNFGQGVLKASVAPIRWSSDGKTFFLGQGSQIAKYKV